MQHTRLAALTRALIVLQIATASADAAADFVVKLFTEVCVPNMGQPDKIRAWADQQHLQVITAPGALDVFVGPGGRGAAWAIPTATGNFALSLRGQTQACAVWARTADPARVEDLFRRLIDGTKRPGLEIKIEQDKSEPSSVGKARSLVYSLFATGAQTGFVLSLLTAERPGGAFQASLQVAGTTAARRGS
jgi:hypothetical protein